MSTPCVAGCLSNPRRSVSRGNFDTLKKIRVQIPEEIVLEDLDFVKRVFRIRTSEPIEIGGYSPRAGVPLLTYTSKMSCASFSMPAGHPDQYLGTCPAQGEREVQRVGFYKQFVAPEHHLENRPIDPVLKKPRPLDYVCDYCYAAKGNYWRPNVSVCQAIKRIWVEKTLKSKTFALRMYDAINKTVTMPHAVDRMMRKKINPHYFRLHDSGDYWRPDYYLAWNWVISNLPKIRFWAPTRVWVMRGMVDLWNSSNGRSPRNLTLRPSGLTIAAPPPVVPGLAAGSMSARHEHIDSGFVRLPRGLVDCPAYRGETSQHTCEMQRCRVCWDRPEIPVNYRTH